MAFNQKPYAYKRANPPAYQESQVLYLQEELKKLERTIEVLVNALNEVDSRLIAGNL